MIRSFQMVWFSFLILAALLWLMGPAGVIAYIMLGLFLSAQRNAKSVPSNLQS